MSSSSSRPYTKSVRNQPFFAIMFCSYPHQQAHDEPETTSLKSRPDHKTLSQVSSLNLMIWLLQNFHSGRDHTYIVDLATDPPPYSSSSSSILWAESAQMLAVQVVVEDLKLWVVVVWQMKSMNFYCTSGRGGHEMGELRESVIREHVLSHKAFLFVIYTFNSKEVAKRCQWWKCQNPPCKKIT